MERDGKRWKGMDRDRTGWDGTGWDGMGWDGVGWGGVEWDEGQKWEHEWSIKKVTCFFIKLT